MTKEQAELLIAEQKRTNELLEALLSLVNAEIKAMREQGAITSSLVCQ